MEEKDIEAVIDEELDKIDLDEEDFDVDDEEEIDD